MCELLALQRGMGNSAASGIQNKNRTVYKVVITLSFDNRTRSEVEVLLGKPLEDKMVLEMQSLLKHFREWKALTSVRVNAFKKNLDRDHVRGQSNIWTLASDDVLPFSAENIKNIIDHLTNHEQLEETKHYSVAIEYNVANQDRITDMHLAQALFTVFAHSGVILAAETSRSSTVLSLIRLQHVAYLAAKNTSAAKGKEQNLIEKNKEK